MNKLNQVDLNLLVALQALIRTKSVTKAALQLNITQSAMSRTLQRLRHQFGDPLFVRTKGGLLPTERTIEMSTSLDCLLQHAETLLNPAAFEPKQANTHFTLMMSDFFSQVFMPPVYKTLFEQAPGVSLTCLNRQPDMMEKLSLGEADLSFSSDVQKPQADIYAQALGPDRLVTMMRKSHPLANQPLTLDAYCNSAHALISMGGDRAGAIDLALAKIGRKRNVVLRMPHFTAAPYAIEQSDLLLTLPGCLARKMAEHLQVIVMDTPIETATYQYHMVWHARQHNNLAHRWLRTEVQKVLSQAFSE
ncbi:LysR family transcriptional regulator [Vibrio algivorus]|uniref:LysR family transcriptional regulator n=1 Tax=Vibrio algivorus TaxID=1667024 RepID=A0A557PAC0_9VIBR|nr:LysR family transcriptional regulator [Vibrio algivorus]TVO37605.1 LysR family transcriptional regulator [Vibrio algivorus]